MSNTHTSKVTVGASNTAIAMGSGSLEVFATPAMIALMENAAVEAIKEDIPLGSTTVGTEMNVKHLKASKIGEVVEATATLLSKDGNSLSFKVEAFDSQKRKIGEGTHQRYIVDIGRFMGKL